MSPEERERLMIAKAILTKESMKQTYRLSESKIIYTAGLIIERAIKIIEKKRNPHPSLEECGFEKSKHSLGNIV